MKQVFPEIRPRRLGTRGNSRYCYAALRKTTQLTLPFLPDLYKNDKNNSNELSDADDLESFDIIRKWASNLLNVDFDKIKDLAEYITKNNLNSSNSNRLRMLQKKMLPKECRATTSSHKKLNVNY